jgi:hypothetical protein
MNPLTICSRQRRTVARVTLIAGLLSGCSSWQAPTEDAVTSIRARATTATKDGVTLSAAVLGTQDTKRLLGLDLTATGVQPVWIEVENGTPAPMILLRTGIDPDYFSPHEMAWAAHSRFDGGANARIDEWFNSRGFRNPIPPGMRRSGVVFTNPARGTKLLNVDLLAHHLLVPFTLFLGVPDDAGHPDFSRPLFAYPPSAVTDYADLASLRAALERLPCCATNASGETNGDPLNAIAIGGIEDFGAAVVRRNYRRNQQPFDNAQYVFGRIPDAVLRKQAHPGAPATWMRAWRAPLTYRGRPAYVLQIGRPKGGRFASDEASPKLHEDVDEARNLMIQDCMYSEGLEKLGFVGGVSPVSPVSASPARMTPNGARYHTDGLRAVLFFSARPFALSDLELLDWEPLVDRHGEPASGGASHAHE